MEKSERPVLGQGADATTERGLATTARCFCLLTAPGPRLFMRALSRCTQPFARAWSAGFFFFALCFDHAVSSSLRLAAKGF